VELTSVRTVMTYNNMTFKQSFMAVGLQLMWWL